MAKHRTIFGSPAIGKIKPMKQHVFRCPKSGKVKVMGYAVSLITDVGLELQFVSSQMYKDRRGNPVDLSGRVCDLSVIAEFADIEGVEKKHDVRDLRLFASLLAMNCVVEGCSEYDALASAKVVIPQLSKQLADSIGNNWFAPAGCGEQP